MDTTKTITHIGLCAGYGGIELGLKRVLPTLRTVALCEIEAFACANLVAKMEAGLMDSAPIWTDLKTFPYEQFCDRVDILTGGYPCQPFSSAGKRLGTEDPRHLWPYIAGGIRLLQPRICFFENVEGHISLGLREVIADLESLGYQTAWGIFSAAECLDANRRTAPHQRKRVFIMAHCNDTGLEGLRECGASQGRKAQAGHTRGCCDVWPSRPGEPQHAWEPPRVVSKLAESKSIGHSGLKTKCGPVCKGGVPKMDKFDQERAGKSIRCSSIDEPPRVVGNTKSGARLRRASGDEGHAAQPDESVGDTQMLNGSGQTGGQREAQVGRADTARHDRQTKPALGLHTDECSSVLGETLTLSPYVANVDGYENLSQKTRARQILFEVWKQALSKTIQWETRGLQCFLAEKILLSGMQLDSFTQRICYFIWCVQTGHKAQGWGLRGMWIYESCGNSSQGQEPIEQLKRELGYALCQLSYEIALERGEEAVEAQGILQGVREASERAWALSDALPEMEEVWRSTLDQKVWENGCFNEATSKGNRTDELRLLGNGVVPATAALAFRTLLQELAQ